MGAQGARWSECFLKSDSHVRQVVATRTMRAEHRPRDTEVRAL